MSEERLDRLINDFDYRNLNLFFRSQCENYAETPEDLPQYDDERFTDFQKLGEVRFDSGDKLAITSSLVNGDLTERSGKKAQYEKSKKILKELAVYDAGFFIFHDSSGSFRFSLVYGQAEGTRKSWSNFRRFTYFVSKDQTNKTFRIRVGGCNFLSLEAVKDAFSVEKVNKEFYNHIARFFYRLTGYERKREMTLPSVSDDDKKTYQEFAVRLIGRVIFCWFLKHKKSASGIPLIPEEALSVSAVQNYPDYYHSILEPLFFEVMNKPIEDRKPVTIPQADSVSFLNGGLFEPHDDFYENGKPLYNLVIPDDWFEDLFSLLEQYNFTIDENSTVDADVSVDPEMLGRIFENLLAEVNPVTGETARKATGSYYTPRTIVDYMVDQSLKQYLITKTKIDEDKITALPSYEAEDVSLTDAEKDSVISALDEIKIIDPACGSGAYPMGILHKMLLVLQKVDPGLRIWLKNHLGSIEPGVFRDKLLERVKNENWEYVRKLLIIQNSIYGVDIQTIAVEISKLRFFLSLIVDEQIDDAKENRGIEALPNLEFKFMAANTLIELPSVMNHQVGLGIASEEILRLKELRNSYLRSYGKKKKDIEGDFLLTRGKLIEQSINWGSKDALALQLANWNPFSNEACDWFDPGWMFGIEDGFDIVIANPPYIKEYVNRSAFDGVRGSPYYQGKMDIWYLFACQGIDHLKNNGILTFIAQNNWVTSYGASKLRNKVISDTRVLALLDFGDYKIFETSGIQTMVMIFGKDKKTGDYEFDYRRVINNAIGFDDILDLLSYRSNSNVEYLTPRIQKDKFADKPLTFSHSYTEKVIEKIRSKANLYLGENEIANGIHHHHDIVNRERQRVLGDGFNVGDGIFVLSDEEKRNIPFLRNELALVKPSYTTRGLHKWYADPGNTEWVIYTDSSFKHPSSIKPYPYIKAHLDKFRKVITSDNWPYGLHRARDERFFKGEKIIAVRKCSEPAFTYTDFDCYVSATFYVIKTERINLKYLTAILNSKLVAFWLRNKGKMQGNNYQIDKEPLLAVPIYKPSNQDQKAIIALVDQILFTINGDDYANNPATQAKVEELERQNDKMVYELYGLTPEEIAVVEGTSKK